MEDLERRHRDLLEKQKINGEKFSRMLALQKGICTVTNKIVKATKDHPEKFQSEEVLQMLQEQSRIDAELSQATQDVMDSNTDLMIADEAYESYKEYLSNLLNKADDTSKQDSGLLGILIYLRSLALSGMSSEPKNLTDKKNDW